MVGQGALLECLADPNVIQVTALGRTPVDTMAAITNPKFSQIVCPDLSDLSSVADQLTGFDICLFCLGVSSVGMKEPEYRRITYDLTLSIATTLAERNPNLALVYVSGSGTDSTEAGRLMWARVKGATENALIRLPIKAYGVRPGIIIPRRGVRSKTRLYQAIYSLAGWVTPIVSAISPGGIIGSDELGRAMLAIGTTRPEQRIWSAKDLVTLARSTGSAPHS